MLAQSFKTAEELGVSEDELVALIGVLGKLERGEISHARRGPYCHYLSDGEALHMACCYEKHDCGTVACIGGWVALGIGQKSIPYVNSFAYKPQKSLYALYWPQEELMDYITPAHAAIATRNFLTHGEPRWDEAMS